MRFETEFEKRNLSMFFMDATEGAVKKRLRDVQRSDVDDVVQDVRAQTLRVLDDSIRARVGSGERETDAIDAVLTRRFISSVASRNAKHYCRRFHKLASRAFYDDALDDVSQTLRVDDERLRDAAASLTSLQRAVFNLLALGCSPSDIVKKTKLSRSVLRQILREIRAALEKKGFGVK